MKTLAFVLLLFLLFTGHAVAEERTTFLIVSTQSKAYTGTAASLTNAFADATQYVEVMCTTDCHISFTGTATTSDKYLLAAQARVFLVQRGQTLSAIRVAASGTVYADELR